MVHTDVSTRYSFTSKVKGPLYKSNVLALLESKQRLGSCAEVGARS